jgi:hypothetical protein
MGTPNSTQLLQVAAAFDFLAAEGALGALTWDVQREKIKLLDATVESLVPQLKYVTNPPDQSDEIRSPYAVVIRVSEYKDGLCILRSGRWLSIPCTFSREISRTRKHIKAISTEDAVMEHDLEPIQDGLASIFAKALADIEERKDKLETRLEKLQAARQSLS